jgi:nucleoside-diphosphate-sugar epimerase
MPGDNSMAKYCITGGAGFLGSNLVEELLKRKHEVVVIDNLATGRMCNLKPFLDKITFVQGSIIDLKLLKETFKGVDYVLHQAAIPSVQKSVENPQDSFNVNATGTLNVLIAARDNNVKKVVYAASSSAYGDREGKYKVETMMPLPMSPYAAAKVASEHLCQSFAQVYGLPTVCLRYFNVFGPRQDPTSHYSAVIPLFIKAVLDDKQPTIYGDGLQSRDFTFIANNVEANILAAENPDIKMGETINIATAQAINLIDLLKLINKELGKDVQPIFEEERAGDIKHSLADINKAKELLNYDVLVNFEDGLKKTIRWYADGNE